MARPHALVAALLLGLAGTARADVIDLPDTYASITLDPKTWTAVAKPGLVAGYTSDRGDLLAITRAQIPNIDAWRTKTRDAYIDQIERGLVALGYTSSSKKLTSIEGVPVLDLEATIPRDRRSAARRDRLVVRVILFRTYALSLAIETSSRTAARAIARTFVPPPARPEGSP